MNARAFFIVVLSLALLAGGWWFLGRDAAAGLPAGQLPREAEQATPTPPPAPTEPPPTGPTPRPTVTPWLDAPYNSYAPPIYKPEATPTPTQVPGTATAEPPPSPPPTEPPPPGRATRVYAPFWIDTASTATPTLTATATISPDATPTIYLTQTPPVQPSPPPTEEPEKRQ
jgi:hypothetical protein